MSEKQQYFVLDDEQDFLELAQVKLSNFLPEVKGIFTSSFNDALEIARQTIKTLFIIDINLGESNGIDIYHKISEISGQNRVIFITGDLSYIDDEEVRQEALSQEGGIDFIEKPVKWHELAIKIRNHLKLMEYQSELEAKVQERTAMLIHADRLATVGTMVSSIVHEVSSPLTFIKANQENCLLAYNRIKEKIENPEARDFIERIIIEGVKDSITGVRKIEDLMKSFRKFYKQEKSVSVTPIHQILDEVRVLTFFDIKKYSIAYSNNAETQKELEILCNKQEMVQVLTNIVKNAVDAIHEAGTMKPYIKIDLKRVKNSAEITISNNGPKIPEKIVSNIFQPFFTTKSEEKGTGLGLAIVTQILKKMNGDIRLSNKKTNPDSVDFIISIPLASEE